MSDQQDAPTPDPRAVVPPYNWRVPVLGDVPNVPSDLTNLATDIAATLVGRYLSGAAGSVACANVPANGSITGPVVTFPVGRFTATPSIHCQILNFGGVVVPQITGALAASFSTILATGVDAYAASSITMFWSAWAIPTGMQRAMPEPELEYTATCGTQGCGNQGEPIDVPAAAPDAGEPDVVCGVCGLPIADVSVIGT